MDLVAAKMPPPTAEMQDRALDAAMRYVAEQGVTSVHHMGTWDDLDGLRPRAQGGSAAHAHLRRRSARHLAAAGGHGEGAHLRARGRGDAWLRIGALKGFVDGSLGSHTAAFQEPFTDAPKDRGFFVNTPEDLYAWINGADTAGLQVMVHAIGDRANSTLLDIFERVTNANGPRDRRFRVEHAQHLDRRRTSSRFRNLHIIASMQPYHAIDDGRWAEQVIGPERAKLTYAFRSLLDADVSVAFGSDWFVAPPTPIEGIYAAVTRRTLDDKHPDGWVPEQKITVEEALVAYTMGGAFASFEETQKGVISPGMLADLTMIDKDLRAIPAAEIRTAKVTRTIVGGKTVYRRE